MLKEIKEILINNKDISGYKIYETRTDSNELFLIKKNVDMDRAKKVHKFEVTVYKDFEIDGKEYKGSATTNIHPTMSKVEIEKAINDAVFATQFVKNPYYPLVKQVSSYEIMLPSGFNKESLPYYINEITKAIYKYDNYEKGGVNSCEIFLNKNYVHLLNSEGVDVEEENHSCMVEFITTWKEEGEEIELYKCLDFSELDAEALAQEVDYMIDICMEKAIAKNTPPLGKATVILNGEAAKSIFDYYYDKSAASNVYSGASTWKISDKVQGKEVKGDSITITLDPFMKNSTLSSSFDSDGYPLKPVTILENGVLKNYLANTRYAHYLGVEPTGKISNIKVEAGSKSIEELKKEPHLKTEAFSDFTVDTLTGNFCGEIRLAFYFDGEKTIPVTGGSISGNIQDLQHEMYMSKELQKHNGFEGPKMVKILNVNVAGIE